MEKNNVSSVSWRKKDGQPSERTCEPEDRQDFGRMVYPSGVAAAEKGRLWHRLKNRRACPGESYEPTEMEHVANIVTHAFIILPSIWATGYLVSASPTNLHVFASVVYGLSLTLLFGVSTLFHCSCYIGASPKIRLMLHICDRATIYGCIACSYTPWFLLKECALYVRALLAVLWIMVVVGIIYQYHFHGKYKTLETCLYLVMGTAPGVICLPGLNEVSGVIQIAEGGAIYVLGVVFFKLDGVLPFAHAIWHLFVVTGALWQYLAVVNYLYIAPSTSSDLLSPPVAQLVP